MADLIFHGENPSVYLWTVTLTAAEKGVSYEEARFAYGSAEHLALHPFSQMPILQHGEVIIYEALAITSYINAAFAGPALIPCDALELARMWRTVSLVNSRIFTTMTNGVVKPRFREDPPNFDKLNSFLPAYRQQLQVLEKDLELGDYLAGAVPTLADFFVFPHVQFAALVPEAQSIWSQFPRLNDWCARMRQRPSYTVASQLPKGV